ncbi:titin isoform X19 [Carya illinoinensis]|uniref:titin isoform X19 n=1 Tax=Carya illinoinensis TaxID=32201 RepID=UPI001C725FA0|nr:titin isoform X19 [Carya illinoinensis]
MVLSEDEKQLQEGERFETGEETGREVKDKMPRSNDTEEGLLEDDTTKVYSTVHSGEKIVKQIFQVDSPEEAASKSSGEDEGNNATVEEPHLSKLVHDGHGIQAIPREQIEKANVVFVTPKPIEEEMTKNHQDNENETKNSREEDGCLKIIKEGNVNDSSQESIGVGPIQNFEDDKKETTNLSKGETASVRACESIALGTIHNTESLENIPGASQQEEGLQGDSGYLAPTEASANNEDKNASTAQVVEDKNDNRLAETTENSAKVTPQGEEDLQQGLQINESPENILGASLVKQKGGLQGEVENQYSTESSIENRDEVTSSIKNTEIGARAIGGEEETDHALKNDEPGETDREVESPGEVFDTAKQGNGLQADDDNLVPPETSINKRDELTSSVNTFGDNHENNRLAEATENSAKTTPEGEDSEPPSQGDETGESIALETAHGVEMPKDIPDLALVKQDEGLQEECEKITPEAEIEKRHEDTSYVKVVEDKDVNLSEATENRVKATPEGQEDSEHALHKHETRESTALKTDHGVENPKNVHDSALVKQEEVLLGEVENRYSTASSIENRDKETSSIKVAEDNDKNNRPVETTENHARVTQQGEEERDQVLLNDEPGETDREVESPGEVRDTVKQGNGLQGDDDKVFPQETSINKRDDLISSVGMYGDNHENNRLAEALENSAKTTSEGEDSEPPLTRDETAETTTLETNHGVEVPKNIPDPALVKQEEGLQAECEELASTEAEIEKGDGDTSYVKVTEDNYANNKLVEATENSTKTTPEGEEDPEKSIVLETAHGIEIPKNISDLALVKQEEGLQAECEKIALPEAEIEKRHEDTSCVKVVEDKDVNNSLAEATENSAKATPEGLEDSQHALHEHETRESIALETYHGVESPKNIPDSALVKQEEVLQGEVENQYSTESSIESRDGETSSIKVAKDNDENNRQAETTENHARVVQQGDEETDHVLQKDESGETNCEAERPREILDTVKQWNYLQEDDDNLVPETSCNKKDELTSSVEVFGDKIENNGQAEAKENSEKTTPESEEDSGHALQRDETGECIAHETNHGVEGPKNTPDPALVKQKEGLQAECEKLAPTEAEIEKRQGYISYSKVAEDNNANNKLAEDTKRNTKIPSESGEDSYKALLTDEPGETIRGLTNHNVEGPENNLDSLLVKQGEGMQGEGDNLGQTKTSIKVAEDEDNIRPIETTRNSIKVILKGEEDSEHVLQKDDPQQKPILERNHDVEKPEENLDKSLVNQEEDLQVQGEHLVPTEASMENKDEDIPNVKMAGHKAENNMQDEDRENSPKGTPKVEDSEHSLNKDARGEIIGCEADHEIESLEKIDSSPLVNQEVFLQGEGENLISKEASEERRDEDTSYMKIANCNDNDDNDGVAAEAADISVKATTKGEENLDQVLQKDEPGKQPEQLLDVVSEDKEPEYILEKMENTTLMKEEGIIQNLEETLEVEKKEETKTVDDKKEKEAAIEKVFNTTSFSEEIGVQMAEEIHNIRDRSPEFNEKELTKENSIEEQQYGALETAASSTNTEKSVIEKPATAELPSSSDEKETVKERIKEEESDVTVLKEEAGGTTLEFIKQTEATELTEKAKAENLQDCAGQSRDFTALTTIENYSFMPEVPVEEINEKLLKQEKNTIIDSDSASEAVVTEEGLKETKPDKKEHVKSFDIVPEEKGLATFETGVSLDSVDIEVQSEENSKSEEIMGKKILTVPDETGEKIEHQMEDKAPTGGIDNELSLTTRETTLDGISGDGSRDYYIMPLQEHVPTATAVGKIMEETSARDEIIDEIAKIPSSVQKTDEKLIQKEDESINPTDASELLSSDDGKDSAIEELKHADAELHMPPKRHIEKNSYETEDVEISKRGETSDLADQTEVCKLESLEVENPSDDPSKPIAVSPYQGSEKTILEQGDFVQTEGILTGVLVEKGTTGMKTNVCSQECEPTNTKNDELLAEKNLESDDLDPKLVFITESGHKDPSHETLPKTNKSQTEENNNDVQDWNFESVEPQIKPQVQGKTETKMAMETKLKAEDRINVSQTTKETITTHIVTEGVHERIQEVSGSEGINEQAIHGESELKETQKVSAEDYALEKVEDCGTKSTDYLEATDSNEQTETVKTDIQEPTREKETSGTKALKEEKLQDEFSLKPEDVTTTVVEDSEEKIKVEVDQFLEDSDNATVVPTKSIVGEVPMDDKAVKETSSDERLETITIQPHPQTEEVGSKNFRMEAVDGSESIKEQAIEQESQLKEIYEVSTEDDILKKMEDYGTKSSNYLEAKDPKKHTETIQEPTRETEASGTKAQAEEKIQDEVSLKHVDVSKTEAEDTKETIKEKIEVEADNFLDKNDNTTMVPAKPPIQEAHMDDNSNESLKTTTIQPCPQAEEVGNKKLQIEEVDGSEGIKEQAIHAASELKETHKVYVEDDILEKVEDFGTKSSDYQEETDYNEQIETLKADIKETARETEASGTKVYAEDGIVEKVEGCVRKSSDVSVETIPIQPSPQAEEVGSKKLQIEEVDGSEAIKEQVIHVESELKKIQKVYVEDDIVEKVEDFGAKSSDYQEEKDSSEQTETLKADIQEKTRQTEASGTEVYVEDDIVEKVEDCGRKSSNYLEETSSIKQTETITANTQELTRETEVSETKAPEEEKIQGEDNLKPVEISTTEAECTKEMIKEKIKVKADKFLDGDDNATVVPAESTIREAHMDEEVGKETRTDESVETIPIQLCPPAEEVGSKKLQIEEGDRSEGIKDQATHAEIELKEIHKVYAEDDMVEKVEDCGRKSPDYLEDTDSSEQTEAHTTNIQEPTKETKASRNNALEDVMIQDEVSLKHVEISTTEAKDTNEAIKEKMETDKFLDEDDNVNAVPAESTIREAHMDEETVKETRSDESVETIPIQPCTQAEEVGSKKLQIEEVDVSEGIKEQAIHAESELKEIHKVYAEDDILEKVKEFGTKSSDYQEETNSNEQTKIFKADVQETTRETEALGAKVYAEDNIVEKVEDSGRKSSEYQEEKDSIKQTETLTADFQEPTRETEASDSKALEEEKIQGEIRLKPAESSTTKVEDTKEKIEENIKVEADKFIDGDDNATAVPTESTRREAHMDDKAIKETRSDESVETIPIQPHPQVEEVGSKKLQIEEVEGSEGIKEHATHAESELKEIHKVYAEDDILEKVEEFGKKSADYKEETDSSELTKTLKVDGQETTRVTEASGSTVFAEDDIVEKVEDCGRKSSDYLKEIDSNKKTETFKPDIQEPTREIETSGRKAPEEGKIQDEVSLKPIEISTTETEDTKETIKENIKVETDKFLNEDDNATMVPTESPVREAHVDDEAVKETRLDGSVESIPIEPCPQPEEVSSKNLQIEEVDGSEGIKEQAIHAESELKEIHKVYAEDDILDKVEEFGKKSPDYLEETDSSGQTETLTVDIQEPTRETEASGTKAPEEVTIQDRVSLKPIEISTIDAEDTKGTIKQTIKVEPDKFLDKDDNKTAVPAESTIREAHMDDEAVKETRSDESVETIPIQPCPLIEEVGSKKPQIEEIDVSEGIKGQATHAESELKEIHKVYAEDDILEKVKDFETKSSDYQEETNSNEQTEVLKADVQETTREIEASGAKVCAEDDIVEKVEDYGRKSSDYLAETSSIKQTETITADTQELTRDTEASETNPLEEEKIQGEVSLKPAEISTTEAEGTSETIKEKIKVDVDKFHDEDDNATAVPTESTIREAHMDDEAVKETRSDESVETIPIQPCPLLEEVSSKKLQIEEVDVGEGIKEQATHVESELKEIHKVYAADDILEKVKDFGTKSFDYQEETNSNEQIEVLKADVQETTREIEASGAKVCAEDDIVEKVEDCGRKSSDYLVETSSIKRTETITADTQELTRDTEASETNALEEEKIQGEVSLKPEEISTTEAEGTKETIKAWIKVEPNIFLDEVDNATAVPTESTIREAHMDDEAVKETRSDESVETIPIQPCLLLEEVGSKKPQIEEVDVSEGIKEQATHAESELKEIHKVYVEDDILEKVKDFETKSSDYQEETNSNEQTEVLKADVQETTREIEASGAKVCAEDDIVEKVEDCGRKSSDYLVETSSIKQTETIKADTQELTRDTEASETNALEEEKIQGEVSLKPAEISTTEAPGTSETIKEKIKVEANKFHDEDDNATAVPIESSIREVHMDDEAVKETRSNESVEKISIQPCPLPKEVSSKKLQIEEVDVSEGIKEQATHAKSELKEIHKVYATDDILEKVKDFGTKSPDYQEETNSNEQIEIIKANVQETTRETEASGAKVYAEDDIVEKVEDCGRKSPVYLEETSSIKQTETITANTQELTRETEASETKALEEEKIPGEVSLKPAEISTTEAESTKETIKEKIRVEADKFLDEGDSETTVPAKSTIREAHMDDEAVKETRSNESVETIPIQPCPLLEEVGSKKLQIEEVDVSEGIKEQATHAESELKEIHKVYAADDILEKVKDFGTKSFSYQEEINSNEQTEILKADVQETTRETEASRAKVCADDDIVEKVTNNYVEDCGRKSSYYLEETSLIKQTETITANTQELTRETEPFETKALEEEKIQGEVSLKPAEISTTEAEGTKETIKARIKVEPNIFLDEVDNATAAPVESTIREAHMDDEGVKETRSDESVETISIQPCPLPEEVGSKKLQIEEVDVSEGIKEQATHAESELKEIHKVYAEDDILEKVKDFGTKSSDYQEETNSNEQTEILKADVQETTRETEALGAKVYAEDNIVEKVEDCGRKSSDYLEETSSIKQTETITADTQELTRETKASETNALEEEKIQGEVNLKPAEISTTKAEGTRETIKEKIEVKADKFHDEDDNATAVPTESTIREAHMDDEAVKETRSDESVESIPIQPCPLLEEVGSKKLQIEEVDVSEGIKEQATHAESELDEIQKVYAEDDILEKVKEFGTKSSDYQEETSSNEQAEILKADVQETTRETEASGAKVYAENDIVEKVEDCGRKSSDYLEETSSIKQTETITANTQELTRETEASKTKAPDEEKIPREVSFKPTEISTTKVESTKETIKEKIRVEADKFLDEVDNETTVPAELTIREAHMDDEAVKETRSDECVETIPIQPCPLLEEVGRKKLQIEEVDVSEGIKEQATQAKSKLKEMHKVYAEDDIHGKVKDFGIKSSDYQVETNSNEQTEILTADVRETTKETEASDAKVYAEYDIVEKVEDCGRKSLDYLEEPSSIKQTETITTDTQELTRETEASKTKAPEEEKIQGEVSLKPAEISTTEAESTKETIKEKIKVEADKFLNEDDSETAVLAKSTIREAYMDDKSVKETRSDESVETIPIRPCPLPEELGCQKLQSEEVDVGEGIKEQATHAESELTEIHKVYAEDDILEKVEEFGKKSADYKEETDHSKLTETLKADVQETTRVIEASGSKVYAKDDMFEKVENYGTKSSDYLEETDSNKQTVTITADIQETTGETESSGRKASEERKIQDEVSLKPVQISTTKAEDTKEMIKENIKVEVDKFLHEDHNATMVPTKSPVGEAHMDDEAVKETRSDESVETIPIQYCPLSKEVGSKKLQIEEVDVSEGIKEQATHAESELKEIHKVYAEYDILEKVKNFGTKSSDYLEETDSNEQIETLKADVQETTRETKVSETKALEEGKIQDKVSLEHVEISTTEAEDTKEMIKEKIKVEADKFLDEDDNATMVPVESTVREAHMDDEAVKETRLDESVETIPIQPCPQAEEVGSKKLQIEEVDGSEGIKEQATHAESELKEIHKVYAEDDILEKVKDFGTKSSDYQEETDTNKQTKILKADVQETTRDTKASGAKVYAEYDIVEKVEDYGRKSFDYLEETCSIKQTETITANTQELTMETGAFGIKAPEEEKIQDKVSLKLVDVLRTEAEDTKEMIKEKVKVEADNILDEDDNATMVPAESPIRVAHMDDKVVKETILDKSLETITIQPCPQAEDFGIEEVDESEGIKEQAMHGERELKESHRVSAEDDILQKVEDYGTKSSNYLEATNPSEQAATVKANIQELTMETELSGTKAPEEENIQDEVSLKPANVSTREAEDAKEKIKEYIEVEVGKCLDENDNATAVPAESHIGEAHMDVEAVKEISLDESLETSTIENIRLEQEGPMAHKNEEKESVTPVKPGADEVEDAKTIPNAVICSKYLGVEETQETGQSLRVEKLDSDRTEEGIKEDSGTLSEAKYLGIEMVTQGEMTSGQTLPTGNREEEFQTLSSALLSLEQEHGPKFIVKEAEAIKIMEEEIIDDKNIDDSLAIKATEDACLQNKEQLQTLSSALLSEEQKHEAQTEFKKTEEESTKEVETLDDKNMNNFSAIKESEERGLEQEEPMDHEHVEKESATLEKQDTDEAEVTKTVSAADSRPKYFGVEETHEIGESLRVEKLDSEGNEEGVKESSVTVFKSESLGIETVTKDVMTPDQTLPAVILEDHFQIASSELHSLGQEHGPTTAFTDTEAIKTTKVKMLDDETCLQEEVSESLKSTDTNEVEETKTASGTVFESKYQTDETGERLTVEKLDAAEGKETKGTSETSSNSKALCVEADSKDEVIAGQTLAAGKLGEQLQTLSSSFLSREQEHRPTTAAERTEEEEMEEAKIIGDESIDNSSAAKTTEGTCLKMKEHVELEVSTLGLESSKATHNGSSNEIQEEEGSKLDQASKLDSHEKEEMKYDDSPSGVQSPLVLPKSEDMKEKHLEAAMSDLNAEENWCKETVEENQIFKNQISMEEVREVMEEKEVAKDSQSVSPAEETIIESHQGDELKAEECPEEETNKTFKATTKANQHEALKLPELIDKDSANENIEKKITAEESSYLDEAEGKNIEKAVSEQDLDYKSGETRITKEKTEVITLGEKETGVEISQKEGTAGFSEVNEITEDIQQLENYAVSEIKIPGEEEPSENKEAAFITDNEDVLPVLQHPSDKALQEVELEHERPGKATEVDAEERGIECEGEKRMGASGEINKESASVDSAKMSLSGLMQRSMKKKLQEAKNLTKEREPMPSKAEIQNEEAETTQIDKARADEEEGDEHKRSEPDSDAPVMVEASKDTYAKVPHKKSHNILSGVGSKVKHSLSKVKKAITGKSSHPKTSSPK